MSEAKIIEPGRRAPMIKNLSPSLPERGKIKIGEKGEERRSQGGGTYQLPRKLDHFIVTTLTRGPDNNFLRDETIHATLGQVLTEIPIRLLYDDPAVNFPTRYACYIGRTLWCSGDGEIAYRLSQKPADLLTTKGERIAGTAPSPTQAECTCFRQEPAYKGKDKCKMNGSLSCIIDGASGLGGVWKFRTTSYNSIVGIMSSLAFIRSITGGVLANIPLRLRLQPKQAVNPADDSPVTIYVVGIEFAGDIAELQQIGHQVALDRARTHVSISEIENEARRLLSYSPKNAPLPGDDANDVIDEFYPEAANAAAAPPRPRREDFVDAPASGALPHPGITDIEDLNQTSPDDPSPAEEERAAGPIPDSNPPTPPASSDPRARECAEHGIVDCARCKFQHARDEFRRGAPKSYSGRKNPERAAAADPEPKSSEAAMRAVDDSGSSGEANSRPMGGGGTVPRLGPVDGPTGNRVSHREEGGNPSPGRAEFWASEHYSVSPNRDPRKTLMTMLYWIDDAQAAAELDKLAADNKRTIAQIKLANPIFEREISAAFAKRRGEMPE